MRDKIETAAVFIALFLFAFDVMAVALEIHSVVIACTRIIYIPVFAYSLVQAAITDVRQRREYYKQLDVIRRKKAQQKFLEDYAKFVSEVHK